MGNMQQRRRTTSMLSLSVRRPCRAVGQVGCIVCLLLAFLSGTKSMAEEQPAAASAPQTEAAKPAGDAKTPAPDTAKPEGGAPATPGAQPAAHLKVYYLSKAYPEPLPLSYAERPVKDKGITGARMYMKEANQSGGFVGMTFDLAEVIVPEKEDIAAKAKEILKNGDALIVADLEPQDLLAVADLPEAKNSILMNVRSSAEILRQERCRENVFHVIPDWAMRADALAQYLILKKWPRWLVVRGDSPEDKDYVAQIERAAKRYGGKIVQEIVYPFPPGSRNTDSGYQQVQSQIPQVTQSAPAHDVIWVVDNQEFFGDYFPYRTSSPDLIVGTQGLQAIAWDKSYTEYGSMTFQNDLFKLAKRDSTERDYNAWIALRALTDAAMRSGKTTVPEIKEYILSDEFNLEGHKGIALNFRRWDHQMRQPIILGGGTRTIVSKSPQEGFLHEKNLTDTLGYDEPETKCKF
jgi:ABC transporter substrate binding protein (PQQ-dependent alcohol dehydrogenase system)